MKISVVTAVFNRQDTIGDTMNSISGQSHPDIEHIVQDGGSRDRTLEIIEDLSEPYTDLVSEPNTGIYDAINRGISRATGDVIGLMHSDDNFTSPLVLSKVPKAFDDAEIDGVYGDLTYISQSDPNRIIRYWRAGHHDMARLRRGWMPPHPTLYLRRQVFDHWGVYDIDFRIAADYDAMLRYLVTGRIRLAYIPEVLVCMRVGGESNRSLGRILRKSREDYRAIRRNRVGGFGTLAMKNARKLIQFIHRQKEI